MTRDPGSLRPPPPEEKTQEETRETQTRQEETRDPVCGPVREEDGVAARRDGHGPEGGIGAKNRSGLAVHACCPARVVVVQQNQQAIRSEINLHLHP